MATAKEIIESSIEWIETSLTDVFPESLKDDITVKASLYSLMAGGKRIRPCLMYVTALMLDCDTDEVLPFAKALEMIHTYSLIHDDLPAMDNDDLRRGKPTCHKAFGEGIALLAGDNLLNRAYEILFDACLSGDMRKIRAAGQIAAKAGICGMIGGQSIDLDSEGKTITLDTLYELQEKKTGALLSAACVTPCYLAGVAPDVQSIIQEFSEHLGLMFQIQDDILDVMADQEKLGKTVGKDERDGKATFVTLLGLEEAKNKLDEEVTGCKQMLRRLESFGYDTSDLETIVDFLAERDY